MYTYHNNYFSHKDKLNNSISDGGWSISRYFINIFKIYSIPKLK